MEREGGRGQDFGAGSWLRIRICAENKLSNDRRLGERCCSWLPREGLGGDERQGNTGFETSGW